MIGFETDVHELNFMSMVENDMRGEEVMMGSRAERRDEERGKEGRWGQKWNEKRLTFPNNFNIKKKNSTATYPDVVDSNAQV